LECSDEWVSCSVDEDCCDSNLCLEDQRGGKSCRRLPFCAANWDDCSQVGCCGGLLCVDNGFGGKACKGVPDCWNEENGDCSVAPCCPGFTCVQEDDISLCKDLPDFVGLGQSCKYSKCVAGEKLECIHVGSCGFEDKQCRLQPGDIEVFVFNDLNSNGVQESNEPGIPGVSLRLIRNSDGQNLDPVRGGNAHEEHKSNALGKVNFKGAPRGELLRVKVTAPPKGALRTLNNKGTDDAIDSDLLDDNFTNVFKIGLEDTHTSTDIGYRMPVDTSIRVFNDVNGNGIQDVGEVGIKGVKIILVSSKTKMQLTENDSTGTAKSEVVTDKDGRATFTQVPQSMKIRAKVTKAPPGGMYTTARAGTDSSIDSDLRSDGTSYEFSLASASSHGASIDLGYRMPETVVVRVWNDANANGIQDEGEMGIPDVKLRLVDDKQKKSLPDLSNGGTAHTQQVTDFDGMAYFTKVPQGLKLVVSIVEKPLGAIPTVKQKGLDADLDSNLRRNGFSDPFAMTSTGLPFSEVDLGYRLPGSLQVRVWDDANGDGIQDDDEQGIQGVKLHIVESNTLVEAVMEQSTDEDGYAVFTNTPRDKSLQVVVLNAPDGVVGTRNGDGTNQQTFSDLGLYRESDPFEFPSTSNFFSGVQLGFQMPRNLKIRVWDDKNKNGIRDEDEAGIGGVQMRLVKSSNKSTVMDGCIEIKKSHACTSPFFTDENGLLTIPNVPKGIDLQVQVVNEPRGAQRTTQSKKKKGSDLGEHGLSYVFNLANFDGEILDEISIGYQMPRDLEVRVWDDLNGNGIQDPIENGISGVELQLIWALGSATVEEQGNGGNAHDVLVTNEDGFALFHKVPIGKDLRVKVINAPAGSIRTGLNAGRDDNVDSDLRVDGTTTSFNLRSFKGDRLGKVDIGFQTPKDISVHVWDDVNSNGIQDPGEPGIKGVKLRLVDGKSRIKIENIGGGSTAHEDVFTNDDGLAIFQKAPKSQWLRVQVVNAPPGSLITLKNRGNEDRDSDVNYDDLTSDAFILNSFHGAGPYGKIDIGFRMPKTMVVRVWDDRNQNGVQDEGEAGLKNVELRLVDARTLKNIPDFELGGNADERVKTDSLGRATFTMVPQGLWMRVEVTRPPKNGFVTLKSAGNDDELDSDLNGSGISDSFKLPGSISTLFTKIDLGYVIPECDCVVPDALENILL